MLTRLDSALRLLDHSHRRLSFWRLCILIRPDMFRILKKTRPGRAPRLEILTNYHSVRPGASMGTCTHQKGGRKANIQGVVIVNICSGW